MVKIIKIDDVRLPKLNVAEYSNLMSRTLEQVKNATAEALGITEEDVATLEENIKLIEDLIAKSRISDITALLADTDVLRDDIFVYVLAEFKTKRNSPLEAVREAATSLYNATKHYFGGHRAPDQQETQIITSLVAELKKEVNAPKLTLLGLDEIVALLETHNNEFEKLTAMRTSANEALKIDNSSEVRANNDPLYDYIITKAFVTSVATPSEAAAKFVKEMNAILAEIETRYNQRRAIAIAKGEEKKRKEAEEKAKKEAEQNNETTQVS